MRKIAVVQFRSDQHMLDREMRHIFTKCSLTAERVVCFNGLLDDLSAVNIDDFAGFIFCGSSEASFATMDAGAQRVEKHLDVLLGKILAGQVPTLFICLGLQFVAKRLGEAVVQQTEVATTSLTLTEAGRRDPLFRGMPSPFLAQTGHNDAVPQLPKGTVALCTNETAIVQGYRLGQYVYAFQFHLEQSKDDFLERLKAYPQYQVESQLQESPDAGKILQNFISICQEKSA